ncbi:MAG: patatin family protein, partial [Methanocorpusculum sp.]|nr:patatin family protein [Methanocorpusculum sp.]
ASYRKGINKILPILAICYCFYPKFVWKIATRHIRYNQALELVEAEEKAGRAFVFRPKKPVSVGRLEINREKTDALYADGYNDGIELMPKLKAFLEAP